MSDYWLLRAKLAAMSLFNPWRAARELREENARLVGAIAEPLVTGINIGNGTIDIGLRGGTGPELLAGMFLGLLEKHPDAKNYLELTFGSPSGPIVVTVMRPGGKTPHQLLMEARETISSLMAPQGKPSE